MAKLKSICANLTEKSTLLSESSLSKNIGELSIGEEPGANQVLMKIHYFVRFTLPTLFSGNQSDLIVSVSIKQAILTNEFLQILTV